jgi:hypothetical protein
MKTRSALIREIGTEQRLTPRVKERLDEGLEEFLRSPAAQEEAS